MPHGNQPIRLIAATLKPFHLMVENLLFNAHISVYNLYITYVADMQLSFRLARMSDVGCNNSAPLNSHKPSVAHPISKEDSISKKDIFISNPHPTECLSNFQACCYQKQKWNNYRISPPTPHLHIFYRYSQPRLLQIQLLLNSTDSPQKTFQFSTCKNNLHICKTCISTKTIPPNSPIMKLHQSPFY